MINQHNDLKNILLDLLLLQTQENQKTRVAIPSSRDWW